MKVAWPGSASYQLGDWHWIFQVAINFRQIIQTSLAEVLYDNIRQWAKQQ